MNTKLFLMDSNETIFQEIFEELLTRAYESWFNSGILPKSDVICDEKEWNRNDMEKVLAWAAHKSYIRQRIAGFFEITESGVIEAENQYYPPNEYLKRCWNIRLEIMTFLDKVYHEKGCLELTHVMEFPPNFQEDVNFFSNNLSVLKYQMFIEDPDINGRYRISDYGKSFVHVYKLSVKFQSEFENISKLNPQKRGRELQKILAELIEAQGWKQEESVRGSNQETDIIIHKDREYYFIECKWKKNPMETKDLRDFSGKIEERIGINGIIVSMSGFTKGVVEKVRELTNRKLVLLFGREDVHNLIRTYHLFDELLSAKYREIVTRKKILVDDKFPYQ